MAKQFVWVKSFEVLNRYNEKDFNNKFFDLNILLSEWVLIASGGTLRFIQKSGKCRS